MSRRRGHRARADRAVRERRPLRDEISGGASMAHPLLSWALPTAAYLSAALILASSAPFGSLGLPPRHTVVLPLAVEPAALPAVVAEAVAQEPVQGSAEAPPPAPEVVEPQDVALAEWGP